MLLLNTAHAIDHMFLLIFAAAVSSIAHDFGLANWEDLMPYSVGAFFMFGIGSLPAGRLGDVWGRRAMMLIFFFGIGASAILTACTRTPLQLGVALTLLGAFSAIYHPVGIPMLVQHARNPGATIGVNGLAGNMGIAVAALVTGFLVKWLGWRAAFIAPGVIAMICGVLFALLCPKEAEAPAKRSGGARVPLPRPVLARALLAMTMAAITAALLFNLTTNGNGQLITQRFSGIIEDPATLGMLLAAVYAVASFAQVLVGRLIDRHSLKPLYLCIVLAQIPLLFVAAHAQGWWLFAALTASMAFIFGAIPFNDAMIVRYVDDRLRSRVSGMRLAVSFSISSIAVWLLGPLVKSLGFTQLFIAMSCIAAVTATILLLLPNEGAMGSTSKEIDYGQAG